MCFSFSNIIKIEDFSHLHEVALPKKKEKEEKQQNSHHFAHKATQRLVACKFIHSRAVSFVAGTFSTQKTSETQTKTRNNINLS